MYCSWTLRAITLVRFHFFVDCALLIIFAVTISVCYKAISRIQPSNVSSFNYQSINYLLTSFKENPFWEQVVVKVFPSLPSEICLLIGSFNFFSFLRCTDVKLHIAEIQFVDGKDLIINTILLQFSKSV